MKKANTIRIISICFMAISVALMLLPSGVAMKFVSEPGPPMEYVTYYYSYISGMPIGYGNWFPILTAILSFAVLLVLIISLIRRMESESGSRKTVLICLSICIVAALISWRLFNSVSIIGVIICVLHAITLALQIIFKRTEERDVSSAL